MAAAEPVLVVLPKTDDWAAAAAASPAESEAVVVAEDSLTCLPIHREAVEAFLKYLKDLEPASVVLPSLSRSQSAEAAALLLEAEAVLEATADLEMPSTPSNQTDILLRHLHLRNQTFSVFVQ